MSWKVKVIAGVLICFVCLLIVYLFFVGRTNTYPVEEVNAKTSNNKEGVRPDILAGLCSPFSYIPVAFPRI